MHADALDPAGLEAAGLRVARVPTLHDPQGALVKEVLLKWGHLRQLHETHGKLVQLIGAERNYLFVCAPDHVRELLSHPLVFATTEKESFPFRCPEDSAIQRLARGITWLNGEEHDRHRRMMNPAYSRSHVELYRDVIVRLAEEHLSGWPTGEERNLRDDLGRLSLAIGFEILFGLEMAGEGSELCRMVQGYCQALDGLPEDATPESLGDAYTELLQRAEALEAALLALVEDRRREGAPGHDVFSMLVRARDRHGLPMSDAELVAEVLTLSIAGNSSVASTLSSVLLLLAQHPEWARRVADELEEVLGGEAPRADQIESLEVLDAVVAESLRLLPTGLWGQRDATQDTHIGPCPVPQGTRVIYSTLVTQRLPDIYPEPYRFRPERWSKDAPSPYAYLAFGAGPRLCIGRALALVETKLVLAVLLQRYRLSFRAGTHIDRYSFSAAGSPLPMVVHAQDGEFGREWIQGNIHYLVDLG